VANTIQLLRSTTSGNKPSSLASGVIAINEADGRIYYRNGSGTVTPLPSVVSYATTASFPATGLAGLLYLSSDTSKLYRWESTIYVEVASVATSVSAADLTSGTLPDARLSSAIATYAGMAANASQPASALDIYPRGEAASNTIQAVSGTVFFVFFTPSISFTVSSLTMASGSIAASGMTLIRMGLYTFDETTATLVARCASDTSLFASVNTSYQRAFNTTGGFPASYTCTAGTRYGIGVIGVGTTMPTYSGKAVMVAVSGLTPRTNATLGSQSDLPSTATSLGTAQGHPFARLT
jgi:hypothetical protein